MTQKDWGVAQINEERMQIAERMGEPDQVPLALTFTGQYIAPFAGISYKEYYTNLKKMFNAQLKFNKIFSCLSPNFMPDFLPIAEASALGAETIFLEKEKPFVKPFVKNPEDVDRLEVPDPYRDGLMAQSIRFFEEMREKLAKKFPRNPDQAPFVEFYGLVGPFDIAAMIRGVPEFFSDLIIRPELADKLLKVTTETCKVYLEAQKEVGGIRKRFRLGDDYPGFFSPKLFKKFVIPYTRSIFKELDKNIIRWWHSDADHANNIVGLIPKMGTQVFYRFHPTTNIEMAKKRIGAKVCLAGNVPPIEVLLKGNVSDVKKACWNCIQKAALGGGYILAPGGEISRGTSLRNIYALYEASKKYGRYPIH